MKKIHILLIFLAVFFILQSLIMVSAYGLTEESYSSPSEKIIYPSYQYAPSVTQKTSQINNAINSYIRSYQGPIIERTTTYDEIISSKRGRYSKKISLKSIDKYMGEAEYIDTSSQNTNQQGSSFEQSSPNPASYAGGSYWRSAPAYNYKKYERDTYYKDYYYRPRYDSYNKYYNWRY